MAKFRIDNTEGFTSAQLATMNNEYYRNLAEAIAELPHGADGADDDAIAQIKQTNNGRNRAAPARSPKGLRNGWQLG